MNETERNKAKVSEIDHDLTSYDIYDYSQDPFIFVSKQLIKDKPCISCVLLIAVYSLEDPGRTIEFEVEVVQKYETLQDDGSVKGYL